MSIKTVLENKLNKAFAPVFLEVKDLSHLHEGHRGYSPLGETHFKVIVVSPHFKGKSRLERHQEVYQLLREEMPRIHALELVLKSAEEH